MNFQIFSTGVKMSKNQSRLSVIVNDEFFFFFFVWVSLLSNYQNKKQTNKERKTKQSNFKSHFQLAETMDS